MAGLAGTGFVHYGKSTTWNSDLDYNIHDYHHTHSAVRPVLHEPDLHDELYYTVDITYSKGVALG